MTHDIIDGQHRLAAVKAEAQRINRRSWARAHCEDCGRFMKRDDFNDVAWQVARLKVYVCDSCNERRYDRMHP